MASRSSSAISELFEELKIDVQELAQKAEAMRKDGQTVMFVGVGGKLAGLMGVADPIKETTAEAIKLLHQDNIRIVMLNRRQQDHGPGGGRKTRSG